MLCVEVLSWPGRSTRTARTHSRVGTNALMVGSRSRFRHIGRALWTVDDSRGGPAPTRRLPDAGLPEIGPPLRGEPVALALLRKRDPALEGVVAEAALRGSVPLVQIQYFGRQ